MRVFLSSKLSPLERLLPNKQEVRPQALPPEESSVSESMVMFFTLLCPRASSPRPHVYCTGEKSPGANAITHSGRETSFPSMQQDRV
jgi:hypothetical protein